MPVNLTENNRKVGARERKRYDGRAADSIFSCKYARLFYDCRNMVFPFFLRPSDDNGKIKQKCRKPALGSHRFPA